MWAYEDYSEWSRQLAHGCTVAELTKRMKKAERSLEKSREAHLRAVMRTSSMTSQSQSRAQSRTSMVGSYEEAKALRDALEMREKFPDKFKEPE